MYERIEKLKNMQTSNLIDVAKNYKKYNYPIDIRDCALEILENRGVKQESLVLSGRLVNNTYEEAIREYQKYNTNSIIGLVLFILFPIIATSSPIFGLIIYLAALLFIALSFSNSKKIAKLVNDDKIDYSVIYLLMSFFLYFIIFFVTRHQIKERIDSNT